ACSSDASQRSCSGRSNNWSCGWKSSKRTARRPAQPRVQRQHLLSFITAPAGKPARRALPEHLPRETETHAPKQAKCDCGGELRKLGEDVSEELEYVPDHFKVIRHVRTKLSCTKCDCIVQAAAPSRPIERGVAGPGLLAHVLVSKYADHLPLYRQSEIYARHGWSARRGPTGWAERRSCWSRWWKRCAATRSRPANGTPTTHRCQ